jgi:hypothetical protein
MIVRSLHSQMVGGVSTCIAKSTQSFINMEKSMYASKDCFQLSVIITCLKHFRKQH